MSCARARVCVCVCVLLLMLLLALCVHCVYVRERARSGVCVYFTMHCEELFCLFAYNLYTIDLYVGICGLHFLLSGLKHF